jgi:uncharacterized protein (DUF1800 family)
MKFIQKTTAFLLTILIATPIFALGDGRFVSKTKKLTEEQRIMHILNRLGFGVRPNDVEKVKEIGINKYIEQQLNPNSINDLVADSKVKNLEVMNLSTTELFAKYPNPSGLLRMLEQQGKVKQGTLAKSEADAEKTRKNVIEMPAEMMKAGEESKEDQAEKRERRQQVAEIYKKYGFRQANLIPQQIVANRVLRATYSEKQLQEVMVDFWQNHFNVFSGKGFVRWYIPSYERDVLRKNALGNFKDLVIGTAQHPAMLVYLDNFESMTPNATQPRAKAGKNQQVLPEKIDKMSNNPKVRERIKQQTGLNDAELDARLKKRAKNQTQVGKAQNRGLNENYARELMELHTLGVDNGYTQQDIIEVAKCFTGWTVADPRGYRRLAVQMVNGNDEKYQNRIERQYGSDAESGTFFFNKNWHDSSEKIVLGNKIKADGINDGLKVIDLLVNNPATAKFLAKKLAVKFVSDNPSEAFVNRIAKAFSDSKGDIKSTLKSIFTDDEFFAPENYRAKIKTPFELAISSIRTLGAETNANPTFFSLLQKMGEVPYGYQAPTGYGDTAEDWVNTGALLERLNFAVAFSSNRIPGTKVDLKKFESKDYEKVLDYAILNVLDGEISQNTKSNLLKQIGQPLPEVSIGSDENDASEMTGMTEMTAKPKQGGGKYSQVNKNRLLEPSGNPEVFKIVGLILGTPEFQRQ